METTSRICGPLSKSGRPCLWECGGLGISTIIARKNGKRPVFIFADKTAVNGNQALILVKKGFFMINAIHNDGIFEILIQKIKAVDINNASAEIVVDQVNCFVNGSWQDALPDFLNDAVEAAKRKACDEKCIRVYYADRKK